MLIRVEYLGALDAGDTRHAQTIMKDLGIEYEEAIPHTIYDCWLFHRVDPTTVPKELPLYVVVVDPTIEAAFGQ